MVFCMRNYALKWLTQRITASILIPLTFWFIYSAISLSKMTYSEVEIFFQSYFNVFLFFIMMQSMLLHSKLGLQTIIEDYVTSKKTAKFIKVSIDYLIYLMGVENYIGHSVLEWNYHKYINQVILLYV